MQEQVSSENTRGLESLTELIALCKRRGIIFQSSEIYGGLGGCWDYGPLGVELKNNLKSSWWKAMTYRADIEGIDSSILMNPKVWKASGHEDHFCDPMVDCKNCKHRFRADQIDLEAPCQNCGGKKTFTEVRDFNLMFQTHVGPVAESANKVYLRPETAQGIFVNFLNVQSTMRKKLPFGIAQIGKSFRNEITPGNFIFRVREFEQMEMQYFVRPGEELKYVEDWKERRMAWHQKNGLKKENLSFKNHDKLAHYANYAADIVYKFPFGTDEIEGIHSRTDFDLKQHEEFSKKNLHYVDQENGNKKFLPYVVETAVGLDRTILAILSDAYNLENPGNKKEERIVLKIANHLAPIKVAVMPLMKKKELLEVSDKIFEDLNVEYKTEYDLSGSIGKRYRRQDEIGTPFCLTVDYDTLDNQTVTIRLRDSMEQKRVGIDHIGSFLKDNL